MRSWATRSPVVGLIVERMPQTLWVVGLSYIVGILIAIPIGIISACRQYSWFDQVGTFVSMVGFSVPTFFTGLLAIIIFSVMLRWLPSIYDTTHRVTDLASFRVHLKQLIMPVMVLALFNAAQLSRFMRSAMLDNLNLDYVRTARAKGVRERTVLLVHVLRNSMIPVVTLIALGIPTIFGGAIITEQIFRVNGLGQLLIIAIQGADIPLVQTLTFMFAVLIVLSPIMVSATLGIANAIITESVLSFLGLGFPPDFPTWGRLLFDGANFMTITPARVLWPGLAISLTVLSVNYIGDGLRDALDPRMRGT